jgi:hypothetical protein
MVNWAWNFATFQRGSRLITGIVGTPIRKAKSEVAAKNSV